MIETLIQQIASSIPPSSGLNLEGFSMDLDHAMYQQRDFFRKIKIERTENPLRLIEATVEVLKEIEAKDEIYQPLQNIWQLTAYSWFEATSCVYYKEAVVFRFVTVIPGKVFYVSGSITAGGDPYARFIAEYEKNHSKVESLTPSVNSQ